MMPNPPNLYFANDRIKALVLLLLVCFVYLPFLDNPLVFDDFSLVGGGFVSSYADAHFDFGLRWIPYTSLGVTWVFFGENPPVFRVQNMLLHGMNVLLLLLVLRLWISLFVEEQAAQKMANWGAWLGALIFACHPLAVYGTGYLVQRTILMATLFTLLMHLAYFRGLLDGDKRYMVLAVMAYFLAVFSKEHSLMVPAILLPMTWALRNKILLPTRALLATWIGFAIVALIIVMQAKGVAGRVYEMNAPELLGKNEMLKGMPMVHLLSVLTQAGLYFKYLLLMLIPNPAWMSIDMRESFITDLRNWQSWVGIVAYVSYGIGAFWCLLRGGRIALFGLALLYPWCVFPTEFASVRIQEIFVLYRAYLWMPGLMLLVPLLCSVLPERRIMLIGALCALLFVPLAWNRLWVFGDKYRLWDDAVQLLHGEDKLGSHRIYFNRAQAFRANKNMEAAIADYKKSIAINPSYSEVRIALGSALNETKRLDEANEEYDKVIASEPDNSRAYYGKAIVMKNLHDDVATLRLMKKSCDLGLNEACIIVALIEIKKQKLIDQ